MHMSGHSSSASSWHRRVQVTLQPRVYAERMQLYSKPTCFAHVCAYFRWLEPWFSRQVMKGSHWVALVEWAALRRGNGN